MGYFAIPRFFYIFAKTNNRLSKLVDIFNKSDIMFEMGKYYLCKKCKEVNDKELNAFITHAFHTNYKSVANRTYLRSYNYFDYEPQAMMKYHVGGIYKCMMDDYLKDDNGQLVYIGKLDGFLFEEVKIDLHGCEKIICAIQKHYGCSVSVEPWIVNSGIGITYVCNVKLCSVNGNYVASGCTLSNNPVNGLLTAYRSARESLAQSGKLNEAINGDKEYFANSVYNYKFL